MPGSSVASSEDESISSWDSAREEAEAAEDGEDHLLLLDEGQERHPAPARRTDQGVDLIVQEARRDAPQKVERRTIT